MSGPGQVTRWFVTDMLRGYRARDAPSACHHASMASTWFSVVVDCEDPHRLARFWCDVLGYAIVSDTPDVVAIAAGHAAHPGIEFVRTVGHQRRKSPLHLDLDPDDQAAEVARIVALGARRRDVGQPADATWVVLADPEDNAFCVLAPQPHW
jgi:hypothetical protein